MYNGQDSNQKPLTGLTPMSYQRELSAFHQNEVIKNEHDFSA